MKQLIIVIATAFLTVMSHAQNCTGDYFLYTQSDLDQFLIDNPSCSIFEGTMFIYPGDAMDPISNMDALQNLTHINYLEIAWTDNPQPISLTGLSNVQTMGSFILPGGAGITNLQGLENLTSADYLEINFYGLTDVQALSGLTSVGSLMLSFSDGTSDSEGSAGSFYDIFPNLQNAFSIYISGSTFGVADDITGFNALENVGYLFIGFLYMNSFDGFHALAEITDELHADGWNATTITGFENLASVNNINMRIEQNEIMPDFESLTTANDIFFYLDAQSTPDFPLLTALQGTVWIEGSINRVGFVSLTEVGTFHLDTFGSLNILDANALTTITGDLTIVGTNLPNLQFLSNVESIPGYIEIFSNTYLTDCSVQVLCERLTQNIDNISISDNAGNCETLGAVLENCSVSYVQGVVYVDLNCDGIYNGSDFYYPYPTLVNSLGNPNGLVSQDGSFYVALDDNSIETLSIAVPSYFNTAPQSFTTGADLVAYTGVEFPLCPDPDQFDVGMTVTMLTGGPRPGFDAIYQVNVTNYGAFQQSVVAGFEIADVEGVNYVSSTGNPDFTSNALTWYLPALAGLSTQTFIVTIHIDATVEVGTMVEYGVGVSFTSPDIEDVYPLNNGLKLIQYVVTSLDPNDIAVNRNAVNYDEIIENESIWLGYTIRFQNTGNASAIFINVEDVIDEDLDITSIHTISCSHSYTLSFEENRKVVWHFENIMLPDSTSNEPESHGYIHFVIQTNPDVLIDDLIESTAAIYFDYNEPVITNTATTLFYECPVSGIVSGNAEECEGNSIDLEGPSGWDEYTWSSNDVEYSNLQNVVLENLTPGVYPMQLLSTTTYCMDLDTVYITIYDTPDAPVITQSGNTLTATGSGQFTWYMNDVQLPENSNSITIQSSGEYSAVVQSDFCTSPMASGNYQYVGVEEVYDNGLLYVSPNPLRSESVLRWKGDQNSNLEIMITDATGKVVKRQLLTSNTLMLHAQDYSSGIYILSVQQNGVTLGRQRFVVD